MSDRDNYNTAEDELYLRRQERINAETRLSNARNEAGRTKRVAQALNALPANASYLDINRAVWSAARDQAEMWEAARDREWSSALNAENEAAAKVNAIAARLLAAGTPEAR